MLEPNAVERVRQLDIDAEIVGIELQPIAGGERALFGDVQGQGRDRAVTGKAPMAIARGMGVEGDHPNLA
jgi:hypothetical protein